MERRPKKKDWPRVDARVPPELKAKVKFTAQLLNMYEEDYVAMVLERAVLSPPEQKS